MKLQSVHPITAGDKAAGLAAVRGLKTKELESLGRQLFIDGINFTDIGLHETAKRLTQLAPSMTPRARNAVLNAFYGTPDATKWASSLGAAAGLLKSIERRADGTLAAKLMKPPHHIPSSRDGLLREFSGAMSRFAGSRVELFALSPYAPGHYSEHPAFVISKDGVLSAHNGKALVPILDDAQIDALMKRLGDDRVIDIYVPHPARSLCVVVEPATGEAEQKAILSAVSKATGGGAVQIIVSAGRAALSGPKPSAVKQWHLSETDANAARLAARGVDSGVMSVAIATATADFDVKARSSSGGTGNAIAIIVDARFDMKNVDPAIRAVKDSLELDGKVPIAVIRAAPVLGPGSGVG